MCRSAKRPLIALAAVGVLGALLGGCGDGGGGGEDEAKVRDVVTAFVAAGNDRDAGRACGLLARDQVANVAKLGGGGCASSLGQLFENAGDSKTELRIDDVRIDGDRASVDATVKRSGTPAQAQSILLVREDGEWRLADAGL